MCFSVPAMVCPGQVVCARSYTAWQKKTDFQDALSTHSSGTPRMSDKLAEDYKKFIENGSCLPRAKLFNNVIRPALLPVPIEDVCIPTLMCRAEM